MKQVWWLCGLLLLAVGLLASCEQKPDAKDGAEAIEIAENLHHYNDRMDYLMGQAERFLRNYRYHDAIVVATYLLEEFDTSPMMAKVILERAKKGLEERSKEMRVYREQILQGKPVKLEEDN